MKIYHEDTKREPFGREGFQTFLRELRAFVVSFFPIRHHAFGTTNDENG